MPLYAATGIEHLSLELRGGLQVEAETDSHQVTRESAEEEESPGRSRRQSHTRRVGEEEGPETERDSLLGKADEEGETDGPCPRKASGRDGFRRAWLHPTRLDTPQTHIHPSTGCLSSTQHFIELKAQGRGVTFVCLNTCCMKMMFLKNQARRELTYRRHRNSSSADRTHLHFCKAF